WLLNQIIRKQPTPKPLQHQSARYLRIAQRCGALTEQSLEKKTPNAQRPTLNFESLRESAAQLAGSNQQSTIDYQLLKLALCPGAEYGPAKRWLPERFAEAAVRVAAQRPVQWILFGTSGDAGSGDIITAAAGANCINRIGKTTLPELITELSECALLLTNDT